MGPTIEGADLGLQPTLVDKRVFYISLLAVLLAVAASAIAVILMRLIWLITNVCFHHTFSPVFTLPEGPLGTPLDNGLGWAVIIPPVVGALIVGFMAKYGSEGIRGHGIPEAMQQVLTNQSRIPARLTFLKPLSAAVAIGTGGPFGAEGPIIATGGALGSLIGQVIRTTAEERKVLLSAGAAAGMAATFGSPVSAALLTIELLLFEFRPRSFIPVSLACTTAAGMRFFFGGEYPIFKMPPIEHPAMSALMIYIVLGAIIGVASVFVTRAVYLVEDWFDLLPIHWMWWPALGAVVVGVIGYFRPRTLGVGYYNISDAISHSLTLQVMAGLCLWKFLSWAIALGSGTSGGTLAPLFTIGSTLGALIGAGAAHLFPHAGVDLRVAALVGMAALFAGASRALLTSVVFAFETTLQPMGLLPLLGGCSAAFFVSCWLMEHTIMTAKIVRHGVRVPSEYIADFLEQIVVKDVMTADPICLKDTQSVGEVRDWMNSGVAGSAHQGYPVADEAGHLVGVVTRRNILDPNVPATRVVRELVHRMPLFVYPDVTLREVANRMVSHDVGRLAVVERAAPGRVVGIITRSDLLSGHRRRLLESVQAQRSIDLKRLRLSRRRRSAPDAAAAPSGR